MRHRAVLFALLGGFFAYAAFNPAHQPVAFGAAAISLASFFVFSYIVGDLNEALRKVVVADTIATVSLVGAIALYLAKSDG